MMTLIGIVGFRVHAAAQFIGSNPLENSIRNTSKSATAAGHFLKAILSILMIADSLVELEKWLRSQSSDKNRGLKSGHNSDGPRSIAAGLSRRIRVPQFSSSINGSSDKLGAENVDLARYRMLREVYELLDSLTREFPLLLSLGDLHWADCTKTGEASCNCLEVTSERNNLVMPKARTAVG